MTNVDTVPSINFPASRWDSSPLGNEIFCWVYSLRFLSLFERDFLRRGWKINSVFPHRCVKFDLRITKVNFNFLSIHEKN